MTMLKKFTKEGWRGRQYIIKGGFAEFARNFPLLIAHDEAPNCTSSTRGTVVGGCPIPNSVTRTAANPFFGNIRQNMDLLCGVGQMTVKLPASMTKSQEDDLPSWLQNAVDRKDDGKFVAEKFLRIEKHEQKRMQEALSSNVVYGGPGPQEPNQVRLAGIEKGAKNRYNNIWPYEHSRVKLQGVCDGGCDYINANHIKAAWSNKRYIATQGPIPATFTVSIESNIVYLSFPNLTGCRIFGMSYGNRTFVSSSCSRQKRKMAKSKRTITGKANTTAHYT
jgi:protein-tyrosine phosphatase